MKEIGKMKKYFIVLTSRWFLVTITWVVFSLIMGIQLGEAKKLDCPRIEKKPVKIEAWLSKRYKKNLRQLRNEFAAMGNTRVTLWIYPAENPSKIVAIGRCVPAYIARHTLRKAIELFGGVNALVHQSFFSSNWVGVGTSLFAATSFKTITQDQLDGLMNQELDTSQFQANYRKLTIQEKKVISFGLLLDNPKLMHSD